MQRHKQAADKSWSLTGDGSGEGVQAELTHDQDFAQAGFCIGGGAGESRTRDTQFRKLLLYPSELQPHIQKRLIEHRLA